MTRFARVAFAFAAGVFLWLMTAHDASAQLCLSSADCPPGRACRQGFLGLLYCREIACNFDRDCPPNQRPCAGGACQPLPPGGPGGGGGGGGGIPQAGEGQACGRITLGGGVKKSVRCRPGMQCRNTRCRRPEV
jgi:hypothetical protein